MVRITPKTGVRNYAKGGEVVSEETYRRRRRTPEEAIEIALGDLPSERYIPETSGMGGVPVGRYIPDKGG